MPRAPAKPPAFTKAQLAKAIKEDDTKRRSKSAAKRAAKKAPEKARHDAERERAAELEATHAASNDKIAEHAAYIAALKVDAQAMIDSGDWMGTVEEYVAKELDLPEDAANRKLKREQTYFGPMLALRTAAKSYVKAKNGILCNGDDLAQAVGHLTREDVCTALIAALKLPGNPYLHLNPGQQSMNLRNKARQALKSGTLTMAEVRAAAKTPA